MSQIINSDKIRERTEHKIKQKFWNQTTKQQQQPTSQHNNYSMSSKKDSGKEEDISFSVPELNSGPQRDLRSDERQHKHTNRTVLRPDRDKRDFKDTHNIKKGGAGAHNWGKAGDELLEEDIDELLEKE